MRNPEFYILILIVILALFIAGCTQQQQPGQQTPLPTTVQPGNTVKVADTSLGKVLVDAQGRTLYYFAKDIPASGSSSCSGQCAVTWPIFSIDTYVVSAPLVSSDFSTITWADGKKQTAYKGWPLYYFQNDAKAGDTNGEGINKVWFVVKPDYTIMVAFQEPHGLFLTDWSGRTLYYFSKDTPGVSTCTGSCLEKWPAFYSDARSAPSLLKSTDFAPVSRADGAKQIAFMGRPLYYFADDKKPGDALGQGVNNVWFVANVSGVVPMVTTPAPTVTTVHMTVVPTTTRYYGGGGGGY